MFLEIIIGEKMDRNCLGFLLRKRQKNGELDGKLAIKILATKVIAVATTAITIKFVCFLYFVTIFLANFTKWLLT